MECRLSNNHTLSDVSASFLFSRSVQIFHQFPFFFFPFFFFSLLLTLGPHPEPLEPLSFKVGGDRMHTQGQFSCTFSISLHHTKQLNVQASHICSLPHIRIQRKVNSSGCFVVNTHSSMKNSTADKNTEAGPRKKLFYTVLIFFSFDTQTCSCMPFLHKHTSTNEVLVRYWLTHG